MQEIILPEPWAIAIQKDITQMLEGMNGLKQDVGELKKDVHGLKLDVNQLKQDVGQLKTEVSEIKHTMATTMATKEDLRNYATLSDVRNIVSDAKNEILKEVDHLRIRTSRVEEKVGIAPAHA